MHHLCGVASHTCQRVDRSPVTRSIPRSILGNRLGKGSAERRGERGEGKREWGVCSLRLEMLLSSKLTVYEAGKNERSSLRRGEEGVTVMDVYTCRGFWVRWRA